MVWRIVYQRCVLGLSHGLIANNLKCEHVDSNGVGREEGYHLEHG